MNFCEVGLKISGIVPITVSSAIHYPNYLVTSVVLAVTERHLVIFVGTSTGIIKKVSTFIRFLRDFLIFMSRFEFKLIKLVN